MTRDLNVASEEEIRSFLKGYQDLARYQSVPLPHGYRTPGKDLGKSVGEALDGRVAGRTVLDVGTYYGLYALSAHRRGAARVVALEPDVGRYRVAKRINALWGSPLELVNSDLDGFETEEQFEVVLCMNVLHHVDDPFSFVGKLAALGRSTLIMEFPLPDDPEMIQHLYSGGANKSVWDRVRAEVRSRLLRVAGTGLPLLSHGNVPGERHWYFSPQAFRLIFEDLFHSICFQPSRRGRRIVAVCRISDSQPNRRTRS